MTLACLCAEPSAVLVQLRPGTMVFCRALQVGRVQFCQAQHIEIIFDIGKLDGNGQPGFLDERNRKSMFID